MALEEPEKAREQSFTNVTHSQDKRVSTYLQVQREQIAKLEYDDSVAVINSQTTRKFWKSGPAKCPKYCPNQRENRTSKQQLVDLITVIGPRAR